MIKEGQKFKTEAGTFIINNGMPVKLNETIEKQLGVAIRSLRLKAGLTAHELQELTLGDKYAQNYLLQVETSGVNMPIKTVKMIAEAFDLTASELLKIAEQSPSEQPKENRYK